MSLLTPLWLLFGLVSIPIVLMYMLKLRRREVRVSSVMLWQALLYDRQANAPWQRIKRNWLLFLQLVILAMLTMSLSHPVLDIPRVSSGSVVVLLDASASMAAKDMEPNRFEAARDLVKGMITSLRQNAQMTLIQVSSQPAVLVAGENDKDVLLAELQKAALTQEVANWDTAFALAAGAASSLQDEAVSIIIVSDGGVHGEDLPPLPADVRFVPVGESENNLAISALAVRPAGLTMELFTSITNYGSQTRQAFFSIYLNDRLVDAQQVEIPGRETIGINLSDFPNETGIISARLSPSTPETTPGETWIDLLDADNVAFAVNNPNASRRVLVASKGNFFLDQLFASLPGIQPYRALIEPDPSNESNQFTSPEEKFDLYVLDGIMPAASESEIPDGNLLLINPPVNPLFTVGGEFSPVEQMQVVEHTLTSFLDWGSVHIKKAKKVQLPPWAEVLVNSADGPLVFIGETQGKRVAVLTFDLHESDLPLQVDYPILFANLIEYLLPTQSVQHTDNLLPNNSLQILIPPGVDQAAIAKPGGAIVNISAPEGGFFFTGTDELGVYAVNLISDNNQRVEYFAVNLFSPEESYITPQENVQIGRSNLHAATQAGLGQLETWHWFAIAGLLVLFVEWWFYHRHLSVSPLDWWTQFTDQVRRISKGR